MYECYTQIIMYILLQALIAKFQKYRSQEVPPRQQSMDTLAEMSERLAADKKAPPLPEELLFEPLEAKWAELLMENEECEKVLQGELQR